MNSLKAPKLKAQSNPPTSAIAEEIMVAHLRFSFFSSQKYDMEISLIETVEVNEARKRRRKKRVDQIIPPGN